MTKKRLSEDALAYFREQGAKGERSGANGRPRFFPRAALSPRHEGESRRGPRAHEEEAGEGREELTEWRITNDVDRRTPGLAQDERLEKTRAAQGTARPSRVGEYGRREVLKG
jgi:hypothetical protein